MKSLIGFGECKAHEIFYTFCCVLTIKIIDIKSSKNRFYSLSFARGMFYLRLPSVFYIFLPKLWQIYKINIVMVIFIALGLHVLLSSIIKRRLCLSVSF